MRFQLDVGGDAVVTRTDTMRGTDWLGFCGISSPVFATISVEQQFAEKLHAHTVDFLLNSICLLKHPVLVPFLRNFFNPVFFTGFQNFSKIYLKMAHFSNQSEFSKKSSVRLQRLLCRDIV